MSSRNRELATLLLAGLVASTAFASAWISGLATVDYGWLPWAAVLGGIFLVAHLVARWTVPDADPTLLVTDIDPDSVQSVRDTIAVLRNRAHFARAQSTA